MPPRIAAFSGRPGTRPLVIFALPLQAVTIGLVLFARAQLEKGRERAVAKPSAEGTRVDLTFAVATGDGVDLTHAWASQCLKTTIGDMWPGLFAEAQRECHRILECERCTLPATWRRCMRRVAENAHATAVPRGKVRHDVQGPRPENGFRASDDRVDPWGIILMLRHEPFVPALWIELVEGHCFRTVVKRALELGPALSRTFDELSRALEHGQAFDAKSCEREFRIALADNDQASLLPSLARVFARQLPRACLHAVSIDTLISHGGLATPVADAAIGPRLDEPDLHHVPLYEEGAVVVVRRSHPEVPARAKSLSRELFLKLRHVDTHIALGKPGVGHRAAKDLFSRHGLTRDVALTVPSFSAAVMVAAKTDLVGAVPRRIAEAFAPYLPIRVLALPTESPRMPLFLVWHARTHHDPAATYFRKLVVDTAKRIKP